MKGTKRDRPPPRLAERLLEWAAPNGRVGESLVGDAREEFSAHVDSGSVVPPALWYWLHVLPIVLHGVFLGLGAAPGAFPGALAQAGRDLKLALRTLARRPGLALAAVTTLALGIAGCTLAFSVVNAAFLAPLPYDEADELMGVYRFRTDVPRGFPPAGAVAQSYSVPPATVKDWQEGARSFEALGAFEGATVSYPTPEGPVRLSAVNATSGVFLALGVPAAQGRAFLPEEDEVGGAAVALISHGFWERSLASDPRALGRALSLNGMPNTVVGIMPPGFSFPYGGVDLWLPLPDERKSWPNRDGGFLQVVGRLADGVTMAAAQEEMTALHARLAEEHTGERSRTARLYSWREIQVAGSRPGILLLLGATGLVLLIACANITSLLVVRALERDRELAIRTALGGGRAHLMAQLVSESVVLALLGGGAAVLVALGGIGPLLSVLPVTLPNATGIRIGPAVLTFAVLLSCVAGLATGLVPALRMVGTRTGSLLRAQGRGGGARRNRAHSVLAVAEMALAFVLLSGAGLSLKSFTELTAAHEGFEAEHRLVMRVRLPAEYRADGPAIGAFFGELTERLALHAAVEAVGTASQMPYSGGVSFPPASVETTDGVVATSLHNSAVTPGYFRAAGIPLSSGRPLTRDDRAGTPPVAVVNEAAARALWPEEDPIGRHVRLDLPGDSVWRTVVGVVEDVRYGFGWAPFPEFYTTLAQRPLWYQTVLVHAPREQSAVAQAMREELWAMDPNIPVTVTTWEQLTRASRGFTFARFAALAMTLLAAVAAALAVVGVYGVVAFTARARRHEFGVRVALGGRQPTILLSVMRRGLHLATAGILIGLGVVLAAGRFLDPSLFQSGTRDPATLGGVALVLVFTGLGASVMPALRATRVDPVTALQAE